MFHAPNTTSKNPADLFQTLTKQGIGTNWGNFNETVSRSLGDIGAAREFHCDYMHGNSKVFQPMQGVTITMQTIVVTDPKETIKLTLYPSDKLYVNIVLEGEFNLLTDKTSATIKKGSYLLYRQTRESHCDIQIDPARPLSLVYIAFSPECLESIAQVLKTPVPKVIRASEMLKLWGKETPIVGTNTALLRFAKSLAETSDYDKLWPIFLKSKISELFCILTAFDSLISETLVAPSQISSLNRISKVLNLFLEDHIQIPSSSTISKSLGLKKQILDKDFEDVYGLNFQDYCNVIKFQMVYRRLLRSDISITALAYWAGYSHTANFSRAFQKHFGVSPRTARLSAKDTRHVFDKED